MLILDLLVSYNMDRFYAWLPLLCILVLIAFILKRRRLGFILLSFIPILFVISFWLDRDENKKIQMNNRKMREQNERELEERHRLKAIEDSIQNLKNK
jgi:ABC-type multidrug transport system fused ATPase/permease subunit